MHDKYRLLKPFRMGLLHARLAKYDLPQKMMEKGIYPYFRQITSKQGTEVTMDGKQILMFGSNAYTGLTGDERVINASYTFDSMRIVGRMKDLVPEFKSLNSPYGILDQQSGKEEE